MPDEREVEEGNPGAQVERNGSGSGQWEEVLEEWTTPRRGRYDSSSPPAAGRSLDLDQCCAVICSLLLWGWRCWPDRGSRVSGTSPSAVLQSRLGVCWVGVGPSPNKK